MSENDERLERKLAAEARIRERAAWPSGPLHERALAIFNEWAKQAALANPQSDTWSSWAFVQDRKKAALKEAESQLLAEAATTGAPAKRLPRTEKRRAHSVADYVRAIGRVMTEGQIKNKAVEAALRAEFGETFFLTNYREAWTKISPTSKARPGRPGK